MTQSAVAGSYSVTYTAPNGAVLITKLDSSQVAKPYGPGSSGGYGGAAGTYASINCSGQITATVTWNPTSDPRPSAIIVKQSAVAAGDSSCSDGLGDPNIGGVSQGDHWSVINNPGATITFNCSPAALSNGGGGGGNVVNRIQTNVLHDPISANVNYTITIYPLSMDLTGPTTISGTRSLIVGQKLNATVNTGGLSANANDHYTWVAPGGGAPFANYAASAASARYTAFTVPGDNNTMSCFFALAATPTISCTFHSGQLNTDIVVSTSVTVQQPTHTNTVSSFGLMQLLYFDAQGNILIYQNNNGSTPYPSRFSLWGAQNDIGSIWGIYRYEKMQDPSGYGNQVGLFGFVQLFIDHQWPPVGTLQGPDGGFPYGNAIYPNITWTPATGTAIAKFSDRPGVPTNHPAKPGDTWPYNVNFSLYIFYLPPDDSAGQSVFIPYVLTPWSSRGTCSTVDGVIWTQSDGDSAISGDTPNPTPFPTWG